MALAGFKQLNAADVHDVTTEKQGVLGAVARTADGRLYRYAKNGAVALTAGATVTKSATTAYASTASGAVKPGSVIVPTAGTVSAGNTPLYEDGILTVAGAQYLASGVTQNGAISLQDGTDVQIASGAATSLAANQYCGTVASGTNVIGTAEVAVPAGAYFWAFVSL